MAVNSFSLYIFYYLLYSVFSCFVCGESLNFTSKSYTNGMSKEEKMTLREEARDMFYHAYNAYMDNAYPADELMPLSCKGRWRSIHTSRGDIDDTLGNFSLTLIDTLDTLAILGDLSEFEHAVKLISDTVSFDSDIVVSVFETNIRVLGGLLSGHVLAEYFKLNSDIMQWYTGQLLELAKDIGFRLLPAFNTTTGIPHGRINLRHGLKPKGLAWSVDTCTACAGTMILEMAALSRLSGLPVFEAKAHRAMDGLWAARNRDSDLMGTVLNVDSGDWIRRDSGVGAGIDSYYEYCLKAYVLLGQDKYLSRFDKHYSAVMKYISRGPLLLDVHMHKPQMPSRNFMDALLAFWPGLQVLKGDIKPAVEIHEMLYQVMQRHNFIPEAFTADFQVHWGQHPLRPEFLESTYFLYKSTGDPHYLDVGKRVLRALQTHARVPCGYAAVRDVRTGAHEDRMDSFVLAETFKYLYLLFSEEEDLPLNMDQFIFTTEAHLLPLSLTLYNYTHYHLDNFEHDFDSDEELSRQCPSTLGLFPATVREPMKNLVSEKKCSQLGSRPGDNTKPRKLTLHDFQPDNPDHKKILQEYGLALESHPNGTFFFRILDKTASKEDAEESQLFIQELRISSGGTGTVETLVHNLDTHSQAVSFLDIQGNLTVLSTGSAQFGRILNENEQVTARVRVADPTNACSDLLNVADLEGSIVLADRGSCMFVDKARRLQAAGAVAAIIIDNVPGSTSRTAPFFLMSSDGNVADVHIPVVFLYTEEARLLMNAVGDNPMAQFTVCNINAYEHRVKASLQQTRLITTQIKIANVVQSLPVVEKEAGGTNERPSESEGARLSDSTVEGGRIGNELQDLSQEKETLQLILKSIIVDKTVKQGISEESERKQRDFSEERGDIEDQTKESSHEIRPDQQNVLAVSDSLRKNANIDRVHSSSVRSDSLESSSRVRSDSLSSRLESYDDLGDGEGDMLNVLPPSGERRTVRDEL
uniref:alpha-1,2-Mannosidase n=1 Tax=Cacopsylla melanoneura TaxID=428564 RepID=A0A8D9DVG5_9HEMI